MTDTTLWIARLGAFLAFIGSVMLGMLRHKKESEKQKILAVIVAGSGILVNLLAKQL